MGPPRWLAIALLVWGAGTPGAPGAAASPLSDALSCNDAAVVAERAHALPQGLLGAIGRVESGRSDIVSGAVLPWPWTINVAGTGRTFADKATALRTVAALQQAGFRSIDVGCFQINLLHHPAAFASLDQAFDPQVNATYAAGFLRRLLAREQSWEAAIAFYHSSTPGLADRYRAQVLASWGAEQGAARPAAATGPRVATMTGEVKVWTMTRQVLGIGVWTAVNPGIRTTK